MIIHSYFTEGYFGWAKLFIKSLRKTNGDDLNVVLSTRNLDDRRSEEIFKLYPNLTIINKNLDYKSMAKKAKVNPETLLSYKNQVETLKINNENKVWKLMIAAEDRLKEIAIILNKFNSPVLHVDIDTYVKKDITPILKTVEKNDFTTRWRIEKQIRRDGFVKYENRATLISVQGYNGSDNSKMFLDVWIKHLCKVPPHKRQAGFGQTSCYYAYLDLKDKITFGDVPQEFLSPGGYGNGILWGGNKGDKNKTLKSYQEDLRK
jgi:hypothetical protein